MTRRTPLEVLARNNGDELHVNGATIAPGEVAVVITTEPVVDANLEPAGRLELRPHLSHRPCPAIDDVYAARRDHIERRRSTGGLELPAGGTPLTGNTGLEL